VLCENFDVGVVASLALFASNLKLNAKFATISNSAKGTLQWLLRHWGCYAYTAFSLLARLLPWNGHRLETTVTILRNMAGRERDAGRLFEGGCKKIMKKKEQEIGNELNLQKHKKMCKFFTCDKVSYPSVVDTSASAMFDVSRESVVPARC